MKASTPIGSLTCIRIRFKQLLLTGRLKDELELGQNRWEWFQLTRVCMPTKPGSRLPVAW
jgi:hypothetical protein